jgi:hypothetical protein
MQALGWRHLHLPCGFPCCDAWHNFDFTFSTLMTNQGHIGGGWNGAAAALGFRVEVAANLMAKVIF